MFDYGASVSDPFISVTNTQHEQLAGKHDFKNSRMNSEAKLPWRWQYVEGEVARKPEGIRDKP